MANIRDADARAVAWRAATLLEIKTGECGNLRRIPRGSAMRIRATSVRFPAKAINLGL